MQTGVILWLLWLPLHLHYPPPFSYSLYRNGYNWITTNSFLLKLRLLVTENLISTQIINILSIF